MRGQDLWVAETFCKNLTTISYKIICVSWAFLNVPSSGCALAIEKILPQCNKHHSTRFCSWENRHHAGTEELIELFTIPFDLHQKHPMQYLQPDYILNLNSSSIWSPHCPPKKQMKAQYLLGLCLYQLITKSLNYYLAKLELLTPKDGVFIWRECNLW